MAQEKFVAFQGSLGANSHIACQTYFPDLSALPCINFESAFGAVSEGRAEYAMIPIENSTAGRVADIHHLMPDSGLHIIAEHFERIEHQLMAIAGTRLADIKQAYSHVHALGQCRETLRSLSIEPVNFSDTAAAAAHIAELKDPSIAAIAPRLAADIYKLDIIKENAFDQVGNTTRFVVLSRHPKIPPISSQERIITTLVFRCKSTPAALYKCMGGFATVGLNMTKLESYLVDGSFKVAQFYADVEGHLDDENFQHAMRELNFFAEDIRILGVYPASDYRNEHY